MYIMSRLTLASAVVLSLAVAAPVLAQSTPGTDNQAATSSNKGTTTPANAIHATGPNAQAPGGGHKTDVPDVSNKGTMTPANAVHNPKHAPNTP